MTIEEGQLFDGSEYDHRDPERLETFLPEAFDVERGVFLNTHAYLTFALKEGAKVYTPVEEVSAISTPDYVADDAAFTDDFRYWHEHSLALRGEQDMFLAGFPELHLPEDGEQTHSCMHVWANNSSVFDHNYAVPLAQVSSLFIHPRIRKDFAADMHEWLHGDVKSRFSIPFLHNDKTEETYYRNVSDASGETEDIVQTIELEFPPLHIIGSSLLRFKRTKELVGLFMTQEGWFERAKKWIDQNV